MPGAGVGRCAAGAVPEPAPETAAAPVRGSLAIVTVPGSSVRALPAASVTTSRSRRAPSGTRRVSTSTVPRSACGHGGSRSSVQGSAGTSVPTAMPPRLTSTRRTPESPSCAVTSSGSTPSCAPPATSAPAAEAVGSPVLLELEREAADVEQVPGQLHQPGPFTGEHQICRSRAAREPAGTSRRGAAPGSRPLAPRRPRAAGRRAAVDDQERRVRARRLRVEAVSPATRSGSRCAASTPAARSAP